MLIHQKKYNMQNLTLDKKIDLLGIDSKDPSMTLSGLLDADGCLYVQERFGFINVDGVIIKANIKNISNGCWELLGNLTAQVTQICVVTGQPVKEKLDIILEERYVLQNNGDEYITEIDANAANVEVLETNILEVCELIAQIIGVEADSFPKQKNTPENHFFGNEDSDEHPFAKLASLKK